MPQTSEKRQLTGLRGVAAVIVMVNHFDSGGVVLWLAFQRQAVDLFFCLSGFTLALVYLSDGASVGWRSYGAARFARIYPLYALSLLLAAVPIAWETGNFARYPRSLLADIASQALLISSWPVIGRGVQWDLPAWSISSEVFCYALVFPCLVALTPWMSRRSVNTRLALLGLMAAAAGLEASRFDTGLSHWNVRSALHVFGKLEMTVRALLMFSTGWLAFLSYRMRDALHALARQAGDAIFVFLLILVWLVDSGRIPRDSLPLLFPFLVLALSEGGSVVSRVLASRPLHRLGLISYSIYLLHFPILDVLKLALPTLMQSFAARLVVAVPLVVLASTLSYHLVEVPCRLWLRRWLGVRRALVVKEDRPRGALGEEPWRELLGQ